MEATQVPGTGTRDKAPPGMDAAFDGEGAQLGRILRTGAAIGIPVTFAIGTLILLGVGVNVGAALVAALWPALVGGPFFGVLFTQAYRLIQMERGEAPAPARPRHEPRHKPHLAG